MNRFEHLPERALQLVTQVGDGLKQAVPSGAGKWLDAGMKLGALKASTRIAGNFVRRNPAAIAAAAAGAGVLWYLAHRRARQAENGAIEGRSTRVEAKRGNGKAGNGHATKRVRKSRARKSAS